MTGRSSPRAAALAVVLASLAWATLAPGAQQGAAAVDAVDCVRPQPPRYTLGGLLDALAVLFAPAPSGDAGVITHDFTAAATYTNPVVENPGGDIADPDVVQVDGVWYLYPTASQRDFRVYTSPDLVSWTRGPVVFRPPFGASWAPDVWRDPVTGRYYLYYTSAYRIGVADADRPDGPFSDRGVVIPFGIDAELFHDGDGRLYMYFSAFDLGATLRAGAVTTSIYVQPMRTPLRPEPTPARRVLTAEMAWERAPELAFATVVEGPHVRRQGHRVELTYSGNVFLHAGYAVGQAWADSPLGPFRRSACGPFLASADGVLGPGHHTVATAADGAEWIVYHARRGTAPGPGGRDLYVDRLVRDGEGRLHVSPSRGEAVPKPAAATPAAPPGAIARPPGTAAPEAVAGGTSGFGAPMA